VQVGWGAVLPTIERVYNSGVFDVNRDAARRPPWAHDRDMRELRRSP